MSTISVSPPATRRTRPQWFWLKSRSLLPRLLSHGILVLFSFIIVYPVIWMVLASFKSQSELLANVWGLPRALDLQNYAVAWQQAELGYAVFNSTFTALGATVLVVVFAGLAGYALTTFRFRYALPIFLVFVLTMQAPVPIIPMYVLMVQLHLTNSLIGLILVWAAAGLPVSIFIFWGYFQTIPRELREAAVIDGCSNWQAFLRVIVPISGPAIATVAILEFISAWNDYLLPLILIRTPELRTLPLAIDTFFYLFANVQWGQVFAALTVGTLPTLIIYTFLQRWFIQGLTAGVTKG